MRVPDWESEGLLDGLDGHEREARADLLDQLHDAGVEVDELRKAVDEERLTLLPVEQILAPETNLTEADVAERSGVDLDVLRANWQALGLPLSDPEARIFGERDVEAAKQLKAFVDAGLPLEGVLGAARVIGESMRRASDAVLDLSGEALLQAGDSERDLGFRYAEAAKNLIPRMEDQLDYVFNLHMRQRIRSAVVSATERETGKVPGSEDVCVAFADLVDFTRLGETLEPEDIGGLAGQLAELAGDVASGDVRLVKTIGDAAMLVGPENEALIDASLELVARAEEREGFPQLRAGVACGPAVSRAGDWYGRPVNVASRVTSIARPGSVLATGDVRDGLRDSFDWSFAGRRRLKGVRGEVPLFRARRAGEGGGSE
jgi:adenylate cyclase